MKGLYEPIIVEKQARLKRQYNFLWLGSTQNQKFLYYCAVHISRYTGTDFFFSNSNEN